LKIDDTSEQLKQLIQIGKSRGYVLYAEIDALLPLALDAYARLDVILSQLAKNGIEILEQAAVSADTDLKTWLDGVHDSNNRWRGKTEV